MEETSTTDAPAADGGNVIQGVSVDANGSAIPQPEATESAEAVTQTTEEPSQEPVEAKAEAEPEATEPAKSENSTVEWLKNKGIDPNSPEAIEKVAEMARNAEKAMHQKAAKASELEKAIDEGITQEAEATGFTDEERLDVVRIKTKLGVREFFDSNPQAKPYEQAMIAELTSRPHLAGDLESLYALAVVKSGELDKVKSQGGREALVNLAQKQQATTPAGNATNGAVFNSETLTPQNIEQKVATMSPEEYRRRLPEINKVLGS